ncbi:UbiA family prenyltransferase [Candidatus Hodarchaeum mangrovi]
MSLLKDISDLLRLSLCILASIVVIIAGYLSYRLNGVLQPEIEPLDILNFLFNNDVVPFEGLVIGLLIPFLLIGGNHVINDFFDFENDRINNRIDRPLVRGVVSPKQARNLAILCYTLAFLIVLIEVFIFHLSLLLIPATIIFIGIGIGYNIEIKSYGLIGNIWVSLGYIFPFLMGALLVGANSNWVLINVLILSVFIFFLALAREVLKDIMDISGDKETGKRSVPIVKGAKFAAYLSGLFYVFAIISGSLLIFYGFKNNVVFIVGYSFLIILILYTLYVLVPNPNLETATKGRKYSRWSLWWSTGLLFISSLFI